MRYVVGALIVALIPLHSLAQTPIAGRAPTPSITFGVDLNVDGDPAAAAQEGMKWVRIPADWSVLEPTRGTYAWTALDAPIKRATDAGVRIVLVLMHTPKWAALDQTAPEAVWRHQPPRNVADWQRFVGAAAARYRGRVAAWQVQLLVDFVEFRGTFQDYAEMLHAAGLAVRQADPQALVVAASSPGLDLSYVKALFGHPGDFDALVLVPRGCTPEQVLEALAVIRSRFLTDPHHQVWLEDSDLGASATSSDDSGDRMVRMAAAGVAGGVSRQFWSGRQASPKSAPVRGAIIRMLEGTQAVGWLSRGAWVYAFVVNGGPAPAAIMWTTGEDQIVPVTSDGALKITTATGGTSPPSSRDGKPAVTVGKSPVFVQGLGAAVLDEATRTAQQGPFQIPRDSAHDFARAENVSVTLGQVNSEHGLYNQRFRSLPAGALVPLTVDGVDAVRTEPAKDAVYVYLDVDHSYAYFVDGRQDLLVTVEVHRANTAHQVGFNILYDSITGYRFTPWQWIESGTGWAKYPVRLTDAAFSSAWGWDLAVNGAGDKKEPLVVRSVTVQKIPPTGP
jgi:Beta-galactosidase